MARSELPSTSALAIVALPQFFRSKWVFAAILLIAGCTNHPGPLPLPPEVGGEGVAARVLVPPNLNVNPPETVVPPLAPPQAPPNAPAPQLATPPPQTFSLGDAIAFAIENNPRLRAAGADVGHAAGQEQVACAPFLPMVDLIGQYGVVSGTLAPGIPGNEGFILPTGTGTRTYAETELGLEWIIYDFGRTGGRYHQSIAHERIAELQLARAHQTVEFDVATAYLGVLLARASRRTEEDAVRRADAILHDSVAERQGGVALREDVLRAEVQLSESREALVLARESEYDAVARLNNAMGRNASWPLEVIDLETQPPLPGALFDLLQRAAIQRPEVGLAQQAVAAAQAGWQAARGEFLPKIFARAALGDTLGDNVVTGFQEGVGLHLDAPLYAGGRHRGELQSADADIEAARADAQRILDCISLELNLAYRAVMASRERIDLARTAVAEADENLREVGIRYHNGNATPTDIVDAESALTRSQQRFFSATYSYLAALARLDYSMGQQQNALPTNAAINKPEMVPVPLPVRPDAQNRALFPNQPPAIQGPAQGPMP
jgi:outer membrane protein